MALIRANGNYLRISSIRTDNNSADYEIYQNENARDREIAGEWTGFDVKQFGSFNTAVIIEIGLLAPALTFKGIYDNFKTMCYILMLCDFSAFPNATLDSETLAEINALTGSDRTEFVNAVNFILVNRFETQEERDSILQRLNLLGV